ncbi:hypothetical protein CsatA_017061 [Cannabis sativa]
MSRTIHIICIKIYLNLHIKALFGCTSSIYFPTISAVFLQASNLVPRGGAEPEEEEGLRMGRGVSAGGGQSSLGYLFGSGEPAKKAQTSQNPGPVTVANNAPPQKPVVVASKPKIIDKEIPAGIHGNTTNNYFRADGQNCGNFITDRPSTKVHAAPGGGSSLGYLFGGVGN